MAEQSKQRPSASEIVHWLGATENRSSMSQQFQLNLSITESGVLDIHPRVLCFHFGAHVASSCCVLNLNNTSSEHCVGFWIETQLDCTYDGSNILGPSTNKTVTAELNSLVKRDGYPPVDTGRVNILTITMRKDMRPFFEKLTELTNRDIQSFGGEVHEACLPVVVCPLQRSQTLLCGTPSLSTAMDVHPTKPWILINRGDGRVCIWNYKKEIAEKEYEHKKSTLVTSVRFIPGDREHRIIIGDSTGFIYLISWTKNHEDDDDDDKHRGEIMKTLSRPNNNNKKKKKGVAITSLAVHREEPLFLWADDDGVISLQGWEGNNTYIRTFEGAFPWVTQVSFHPTDRNCFIEVSGLIKVWKIDSISTQPTTTTLGQKTGNEPTGTTKRCGLFDYPYTEGGRKPTIAVLRAGSAEIWDLESGHMVGEITFDDGAFGTAIACHPLYPVIILGTKDRVSDTVTISWYSSDNYRLEKMIKYTDRVARIQEFGFLCSKWLVTRDDSGEIHVLEIDMAQ